MFKVIDDLMWQQPSDILKGYKKKEKYMEDYFQLFITIPEYLGINEINAEEIKNLSRTRNNDLKKIFNHCFKQYLQEVKCDDLAKSLISCFSQKAIDLYNEDQLEQLISQPEAPKYNLSSEIVNNISMLALSDKQMLTVKIAEKLNIELENSEDDINLEENSIDKIESSFDKKIINLIGGANNIIFFSGSSGVNELKEILRDNNIPLTYNPHSTIKDEDNEKIYLKDKDFTVLSGLESSISSWSSEFEPFEN